MYGLCVIFFIFDLISLLSVFWKTLDCFLSLNFDIFYYLSLICFLMLTGLTTLFYVGHLVKKNGAEIEKNTRKRKKTKHLIVVRCDDTELRDAIYNIISTKGSIPLTCADAIKDGEEEKLWYLTARIDKGSYYMIKISITDYNEKELYSLARSSHEKDNSVALIKYDIEKTL